MPTVLTVVVVLALLLGAAGGGLAAGPAVPLYDGLGGLSRKVTTTSPEAQRYFDQGLAFVYAFNHDEAIRAFRARPSSTRRARWPAGAWRYANGPHINNPVVPEDRAKAAWEALGRAKAVAAPARARSRRRSSTRSPRATRTRRPRTASPSSRPTPTRCARSGRPTRRTPTWARSSPRPWPTCARGTSGAPDGTPQPGTEELLATLDAVLALDPKHPLANHLLIHAVEASPHPEKADRAADTLRDLQPGLGHLVHMPSHVDVRRGRWQEAIAANTKAIEADRRYTARAPEQGFYRLYMAHNHHMLTYGAMMTGQSALALASDPDDGRRHPARVLPRRTPSPTASWRCRSRC